MDKNAKKKIHNFSVINAVGGQSVTHVFAVDSRADLQQWMEAFWQHFFDLSKLIWDLLILCSCIMKGCTKQSKY